MPNTKLAKLTDLSTRIYKEWYNKVVLVPSCDDSYEGEFDLSKREIDIPVYHDTAVYQTTVKEMELKPAPIEFLKSSTKRVAIDKVRYNHWGTTKANELINNLSQDESEARKKIINKWAREAEDELGIWCAQLPAKQQIDLITLLTVATTNENGLLTKDNIILALDILKGHAIKNKMSPDDFKLYTSEKFESVLRDSKILLGSNLNADEAFKNGFVAYANGVDVRKIEIPAITNRNASTALVDAEWGIWKTRDGIQYVVPFRETSTYEITPDKILLGGTGYISLEMYDFFNIYPARLWKVKIRYSGTANPPTSF